MSREDEDHNEQAFRQVRAVLNTSHRSGRYVKDAGKALHGAKTEQVGLSLSEVEVTTFTKVCTHWDISFTGWATYAILRFIEMQQAESVPAESGRVIQLRQWTSPERQWKSSTLVVKNLKLAKSVRERFMRDLTGIPISRAVRWVLLDEAPRALATPSKAERLAAYEAVRVEFNKPRPSRPTVLLPTGQGWMDPSGDDR